MGNEWRDNIWLVLGITIVGLAVWYFSIQMYFTLYSYFIPLGFDREDVYVLNIGKIDSSSPDYISLEEEGSEMNSNDIKTLLAKVRGSEHVVAAGLSYNGAPYELSYMGRSIFMTGDQPDTIGYSGNQRQYSPEVARILNLRSVNGHDASWLEERLRNGELIISTLPYGSYYPLNDPLTMIGRNVNYQGDSVYTYRVADVVENIRRSGFDWASGGMIIHPIDESLDVTRAWNIMLKVKPGHGKMFREEFEHTPDMQALRNIYLHNLSSLEEKRAGVERESNIDLRLNIAVICFIVIVVGLGLMGTFWFRVQQRVSEIAIRRVCGATKRDIFRRIIGEGLLLLLFAVPLISAIGAAYAMTIGKEELEEVSCAHMIWLEAGACVVVALGIVLSMIVPARQAMSIEPAIAVKDE